MTDISVENCVSKIGNKFKLVLLASYRAKSFISGSHSLHETWENRKNYLIALKEIDDGLLDVNELEEATMDDLNKQYLSKEDADNVDAEKSNASSSVVFSDRELYVDDDFDKNEQDTVDDEFGDDYSDEDSKLSDIDSEDL
ncbi:MAG: DNA-directed RNA polymerase subunit omega [Rickettsiales bacterium]|nr:DNA-directed RNA polymerase subunit omega [Rickettsiales bacterium]